MTITGETTLLELLKLGIVLKIRRQGRCRETLVEAVNRELMREATT